jgi:lactoylglutathione lyase
MELNLIVIKTNNLEEVKSQYSALGLDFVFHNHGTGPFHYSTNLDGTIFEIYPLPKSSEVADSTTRLGFKVEKLNDLIPKLKELGWKVFSEPKAGEWGIRAVIQDIDQRKVELVENRL